MDNNIHVESFTLDHAKVDAPYIRLAGIIRGEAGDEVYEWETVFRSA